MIELGKIVPQGSLHQRKVRVDFIGCDCNHEGIWGLKWDHNMHFLNLAMNCLFMSDCKLNVNFCQKLAYHKSTSTCTLSTIEIKGLFMSTLNPTILGSTCTCTYAVLRIQDYFIYFFSLTV